MLMNVINNSIQNSSGQSFKFIKHFRHFFPPKSPHLIKTNNRNRTKNYME